MRNISVIALGLAGVVFGGLAADRALSKAASGAVDQLVAEVERRWGLELRVWSHRITGWDTVELDGVELWLPGVRTPPLATVPLARVRAGLSLRGAIVARSIELDGTTLRLGPEFVDIVRNALAKRSGPTMAADRSSRRSLPDISLRASTLLVEGPDGSTERWDVPVATIEPAPDGTLSGAAELRTDTGELRFLSLGGSARRGRLDISLEANEPIRPAIAERWVGRSVAFRGIRLDAAGLSLRNVEVSVPTSVGVEVMATLPMLRIRPRTEESPTRFEIARPEVRIERYPDGTSNVSDLLDNELTKAPASPAAGGEPETSMHAPVRPALRVQGGRFSLVEYGRAVDPVSLLLERLDIELEPRGDAYDVAATWNPGRGAGVLSTTGRWTGSDDFSLHVDSDSLDIAHIGDGDALDIRGGRASGSLEINGNRQGLRTSGRIRIDGGALSCDLLSTQALEDIDLTADLDVRWDRATEEVQLVNLVATLDDLEITAWGRVDKDGDYDVHVVLGPLPADDIVRSLPKGLLSKLASLQLAGHVTLRVQARGSVHDLSTLRLQVDGEQDGFQWIAGGPEITALRRPFVYHARQPDGAVVRVAVDPDVEGFTKLRHIPRSLQAAITSSEDVGFWRHDGFDFRQIGASLVRNLEAGEIKRGGSTLTQQLVKNLFLDREKTISRKLQEAYLTWRMEDELSKARILEIYLNVVEWAEGVYGVQNAAHHFFRKPPHHLTLRESAFLTAILPNPILLGTRDARGRPTPYVRGRVERILRRMVLLGHLPASVYASAGPLRLHQAL